MITKHILTKFGLIKDENNLKLKEVFKNNSRLKEIHIDAYPENPLIASTEPFILLLRTIEKKVIVENDGERLVLKRASDKFGTHFLNVPFPKIKECCYKDFNGCFEFILNIQNTYYKITIFN